MFGRVNRVSSVRRSGAGTAGRLRWAAWGAVEALEGRVLILLRAHGRRSTAPITCTARRLPERPGLPRCTGTLSA